MGNDGGAWVAYHPDWPGSAVFFNTEIAALRYAVNHSMHVKSVDWGDKLP